MATSGSCGTGICLMTGIGPVAVRCPRVRDRVGEGPERIRFSSAILPPYARRSKSLEVLIPRTEIGAIDPTVVRQSFLAEAPGSAQPTHVFRQYVPERPLPNVLGIGAALESAAR